MIKSHESEFAVVLLGRALSVSKDGYYHWKIRAPSQRAQVRAQLHILAQPEHSFWSNLNTDSDLI
jgi:hypothetical protein